MEIFIYIADHKYFLPTLRLIFYYIINYKNAEFTKKCD